MASIPPHPQSANDGAEAIVVGNWEKAIAHYLAAIYALWNNVGTVNES